MNIHEIVFFIDSTAAQHLGLQLQSNITCHIQFDLIVNASHQFFWALSVHHLSSYCRLAHLCSFRIFFDIRWSSVRSRWHSNWRVHVYNKLTQILRYPHASIPNLSCACSYSPCIAIFDWAMKTSWVTVFLTNLSAFLVHSLLTLKLVTAALM